jgi:hypothetical protein
VLSPIFDQRNSTNSSNSTSSSSTTTTSAAAAAMPTTGKGSQMKKEDDDKGDKKTVNVQDSSKANLNATMNDEFEMEADEEEDDKVVEIDLNESIISVKDFVAFLQNQVEEFDEAPQQQQHAPAGASSDSNMNLSEGGQASSSEDLLEEASFHATGNTSRSSTFVTLENITSTQFSRLVYCLGPARDFRRMAEAIRKRGFDGLTLQEAYAFKDVRTILEDLGLKACPSYKTKVASFCSSSSSSNNKKKYIHPLAVMKLELLLASMLRERGVDHVPTQDDVDNMKEYVQSLIDLGQEDNGGEEDGVEEKKGEGGRSTTRYQRSKRYELRVSKDFQKEREEDIAEMQMRKERHFRKRAKCEEKKKKQRLMLDSDGIEAENSEYHQAENSKAEVGRKRQHKQQPQQPVIMSPNLVKYIQKSTQK